MSRKRPADTEVRPESATKSSKPADSAGFDNPEYQTVQFKQSRAEVRPAADGRLFADPPFPIPAASFDISKGLKLSSKQVIKKGDLDMIYFRPFLSASLATSLYTWCLSELPWFLVQYKARGMDIKTPRYTVSENSCVPSLGSKMTIVSLIAGLQQHLVLMLLTKVRPWPCMTGHHAESLRLCSLC